MVRRGQHELRGAGFWLLDPGFRQVERSVLQMLLLLPSSLREILFFSETRLSLFLQKGLQHFLGGSQTIRYRFVEGPLTGYLFECLSSEKYFLMGGSFEQEAQKTFRRLVASGDIVYDIGAHIGYATLLFSALCGSGGHVFAFEPSATSFRRLQRNVELNTRGNITALNLGVSDTEGVAVLEDHGSCSAIIPGGSAQTLPSPQVRLVRLDSFISDGKNPSPDFVKIDIEGHAGHCMAGMESVLEKYRPKLVIELHHRQEAEVVSTVLARHSYATELLDSPDRFPRRIIATHQ
jgi:FkbM family methyltransferase